MAETSRELSMKLSPWIVTGMVLASVGFLAFGNVRAQTVPAPSATPTPATAEAASAHAKATYQELCTGCHDASVIETQGYSRAQWDETVHSMVDRGLTSTPEQLDEIIGYLAKNFPPQGSQK